MNFYSIQSVDIKFSPPGAFEGKYKTDFNQYQKFT